MQTLNVTSHMHALIGGAFYPTGFTLVMYPSESDARAVASRLSGASFTVEDIFLVPPAVVFEQIFPTADGSDGPLPSMGSDGSAVRQMAELAREGHYGLLVRTPNTEAREALRALIAGTAHSLAMSYQSLAIENL